MANAVLALVSLYVSQRFESRPSVYRRGHGHAIRYMGEDALVPQHLERTGLLAVVGGTGHYLNRSAEFETSVLNLMRSLTQPFSDAARSDIWDLPRPI